MSPRTWYLEYRQCQKGLTFLDRISANIQIHSHPIGAQIGYLDQSVKSGTSSDMGTHTTRFLYTQSFRRCFDKREASSNLIPYFLSLESSLADKDVFCTLLEPFHVRRPEPAAWIYLHVYNRRRTFLYAFARGKNSWRWASCSYW